MNAAAGYDAAANSIVDSSGLDLRPDLIHQPAPAIAANTPRSA